LPRPKSVAHRIIEMARSTGFESVAKYVTPELACIVWIERTNAKVGGRWERRSHPMRSAGYDGP
jgi:hypothetical protein